MTTHARPSGSQASFAGTPAIDPWARAPMSVGGGHSRVPREDVPVDGQRDEPDLVLDDRIRGKALESSADEEGLVWSEPQQDRTGGERRGDRIDDRRSATIRWPRSAQARARRPSGS